MIARFYTRIAITLAQLRDFGSEERAARFLTRAPDGGEPLSIDSWQVDFFSAGPHPDCVILEVRGTAERVEFPDGMAYSTDYIPYAPSPTQITIIKVWGDPEPTS